MNDNPWHRMHIECLARLNEEMARAEAAEAVNARLREALGTCRQSAHTATDKALRKIVLEVTDAALSDTAQRETDQR